MFCGSLWVAFALQTDEAKKKPKKKKRDNARNVILQLIEIEYGQVWQVLSACLSVCRSIGLTLITLKLSDHRAHLPDRSTLASWPAWPREHVLMTWATYSSPALVPSLLFPRCKLCGHEAVTHNP